MAFKFAKSVNPNTPLDISDPPPDDWDTIDTQDYRRALFGYPPTVFTECIKWEKREVARYKKLAQN